MLTAKERKLVSTAKYFGSLWGVKGKGLSPDGMVAQSRGAAFSLSDTTGAYYTLDMMDCANVTNDVAEWLGLTADMYLRLCEKSPIKIRNMIRKLLE